MEAAEQTYDRARAGFYGLRALLLTLAFAALVGQPRAEGLCRIDPADLGRLIGLDRAPEVKTVRRRMSELAAQGSADRLLAGLARRHVNAHAEAVGVLYIDGHVHAYHGKADVSKKHLARMRLSMPAEEDTWIYAKRLSGLLNIWASRNPPEAITCGNALSARLSRASDHTHEISLAEQDSPATALLTQPEDPKPGNAETQLPYLAVTVARPHVTPTRRPSQSNRWGCVNHSGRRAVPSGGSPSSGMC